MLAAYTAEGCMISCRPDCTTVLCVCCSSHCVPAADKQCRAASFGPMCLTALLHPCCSSHSSHEELRCVLAVVRHGDRTPKQKMKMKVTQVGKCTVVRGTSACTMSGTAAFRCACRSPGSA